MRFKQLPLIPVVLLLIVPFLAACSPSNGNEKGGKGHGPMAPKGTNPSDLTDPKWDYGSTDGEIFNSIRNGIGPKFDMKPYKDRIPERDTWNLVNYLRSLNATRK